MIRLIKLIILDILKNRIMIIYMMVLALLSWGVFSLEDNSTKGLLTLLNIVLMIVHLVSIIFSTIYQYNSSEFVELLLSQPIERNKIWLSLFIGLSISLILAFVIGAGIPLIIFECSTIGFMMVGIGCLVSIIFVAIAFLSVILTRDKAKGIGISIMCWLFFALLFDGIVLFLMFQFAEYPIEKAMVGITALNPITLSRILILLHLDVSAMMGYTGAIFKDFFGTTLGLMITFFLIIMWIFIPFYISLVKFKKMDL
ncbi:MAG: ABC transporter permease subunit [Saprospiraceae bacterium]|nr:ABC transporter permease subunit [Candidatus Defluviibacterium haderslevense]